MLTVIIQTFIYFIVPYSYLRRIMKLKMKQSYKKLTNSEVNPDDKEKLTR